MAHSLFHLPFSDFDYESALPKYNLTGGRLAPLVLQVTGKADDIDKFESDFELPLVPSWRKPAYGLSKCEPDNEKLAQAFNDSGVFKPFTCVPGK